MTICGYNQKIGDALIMLVDGLIDAMERRVTSEGPVTALKVEINELEIMIKTMNGHGTMPDMFVGLNVLALHLFKAAHADIESNSGATIRSSCQNNARAFINTLSDAEAYREDLEVGKLVGIGHTELIARVAKWVNENGDKAQQKAATGK